MHFRESSTDRRGLFASKAALEGAAAKGSLGQFLKEHDILNTSNHWSRSKDLKLVSRGDWDQNDARYHSSIRSIRQVAGTCDRQPVPRFETCQTIGRNLASIQITTDAIRNEQILNAVLYRNLMRGQFSNLLKECVRYPGYRRFPHTWGRSQMLKGFNINLHTIAWHTRWTTTIDIKP